MLLFYFWNCYQILHLIDSMHFSLFFLSIFILFLLSITFTFIFLLYILKFYLLLIFLIPKSYFLFLELFLYFSFCFRDAIYYFINFKIIIYGFDIFFCLWNSSCPLSSLLTLVFGFLILEVYSLTFVEVKHWISWLDTAYLCRGVQLMGFPKIQIQLSDQRHSIFKYVKVFHPRSVSV